jgi:hypothetical protein
VPKTLPSTVVQIIDYLHPRLGITPQNVAGRPEQIKIDDNCAVMLSTILSVVEEIPDELLQVQADRRAQFHAAVEDIKRSIGLLTTRARPTTLHNAFPQLRPMEWLDRHHIPIYNRYATEVLRDVLRDCPDQAVQPATLDLPFISEIELRESLRLDISYVNTALSNGNYKAATILAGSVLEALLLWGLSQKAEPMRGTFIESALQEDRLAHRPSNDLNSWNLHEFIEVSVAGKLIREHTGVSARHAKDFRNLIHPGRSVRLNQECNRGTALSSTSAVEHVVTDFTNAPP